jgi:hypothetical protein
LEIVQTGRTGNAKLKAVFIARDINRNCSGAVVAPWEIEQLPDDWLDTFLALNNDMPEMQEGQKKVEDLRAKWLQSQGYKHGRA